MHGTKVQHSEEESRQGVVAKCQVRIVDEAEISSSNGECECYIFGRMGLTALPDEVQPKY